jgi:myo-inositol-1(or 4)-monophosphatase
VTSKQGKGGGLSGMIDLKKVMDQVKQVAIATGQMQKENLGWPGREIAVKSSAVDLVTDMDKKSEEAIICFIRENFPDHGILAEESGRSAEQSDYVWVIDPLDGTTNYAQGLPIFAVSIALQHLGKTVLGVVYTPVTDQLFTAIRDQGAYLNGKKLQVSPKDQLLDCVLATGFPYDIVNNQANNITYFSRLVLKTRAIRRMGAAAYDIACVAAGKFDGYWEMKLSPWDVAAALLMVEEAGGRVIHFRDDRGISVIVGNKVICDKIYAEIKEVDGCQAR